MYLLTNHCQLTRHSVICPGIMSGKGWPTKRRNEHVEPEPDPDVMIVDESEAGSYAKFNLKIRFMFVSCGEASPVRTVHLLALFAAQVQVKLWPDSSNYVKTCRWPKQVAIVGYGVKGVGKGNKASHRWSQATVVKFHFDLRCISPSCWMKATTQLD